MKMTMHIDDALLGEVMETYGCATKTDAVDFALKELVRKRKLRDYAKTGLGLTAAELRASVDPDYDLISLRVAETPAKPNARRRPRR
jgi:Arc/MetJ family transcription regulator